MLVPSCKPCSGLRTKARGRSLKQIYITEQSEGNKGWLRGAGKRGEPVVLSKSDLIDNLEVVIYHSIPIRAPFVRSVTRGFRFLPEPRVAPIGDLGPPPSTRRFAALGQATQTDTVGSVVVGLAVRRMERLAIQRLYRQSRDRHRLAPERLSSVLGLEGPSR